VQRTPQGDLGHRIALALTGHPLPHTV
jgi:hypothetical protein